MADRRSRAFLPGFARQYLPESARNVADAAQEPNSDNIAGPSNTGNLSGAAFPINPASTATLTSTVFSSPPGSSSTANTEPQDDGEYYLTDTDSDDEFPNRVSQFQRRIQSHVSIDGDPFYSEPDGSEPVNLPPTFHPLPSLKDILAAGRGAQRRRTTPQKGPRKKPFYIYHEFLQEEQVLGALASHMDVETLLRLYSVCKDFHAFVDRAATAVMVANARNNAPNAMKVFHWRCYRGLTQYDPNLAVNEVVKTFEGREQTRDVPSLKWLIMVCDRERVVESILFELAEAGHRLPSRATSVIMKLWLMMDMPVNVRRIQLIHSTKFFSDSDLYIASMFFMKLDMRFNDPLDSRANTMVRELMLAQRTMTVLDDVLQRTEMRNRFRWLQMFTEWKIDCPRGLLPDRYQENRAHVFGVPKFRVGHLMKERWDQRNPRMLLRPDQLVRKEAIRRDLFLEKWYLDMMLWGYIDTRTGRDIWPTSTEIAVRQATDMVGFKNLPEWAKTVETGGYDEQDDLAKAFDGLACEKVEVQDGMLDPEGRDRPRRKWTKDEKLKNKDNDKNKMKRKSSSTQHRPGSAKRQEFGAQAEQGESSVQGARAAGTQAGQASPSPQTQAPPTQGNSGAHDQAQPMLQSTMPAPPTHAGLSPSIQNQPTQAGSSSQASAQTQAPAQSSQDQDGDVQMAA